MGILALYVALFTVLTAVSDGRRSEYREDGISVDIRLPVKHVLSKELQVHSLSHDYAICFFSPP